MQLRIPLLGLLALLASATSAFAEGEVQARTVYFKERATRVVPPTLDGKFTSGEYGQFQGHLLVDAITSASVAAGAEGEPFREKRYELSAGYKYTRSIYMVGGIARYSSEPDYTSAYGQLNARVELLQRNFTIDVAGAYGSDDANNAGAGPMAPRVEGKLKTYLGSVTLSQILSRNAIGQITYDLIYLDGFQQNPYRAVAAGGQLMAERHPDTRLRHAVAGQVRYFREASSTTFIGNYRYYQDDWGLRAHTPEVRVIQDAGDTMQVGLRYRFHHQGAADFYQDQYATGDPAIEPFLTDDTKLSSFNSHWMAVKFTVTGATFGFEDRLGAVRGDLIIEYDVADNDFGNAGVAQAALTIPIEY